MAFNPEWYQALFDPLQDSFWQSSPWNEWRGDRSHQGVDWATYGENIPVYAPQEGTVIFVATPETTYGGLGMVIHLQHPDGTITKYAHLSASLVREGDVISADQQFAVSGGEEGDWRDGESTGPHLHFEVWQNGQNVDPLAWLENNDPTSTMTTQTSEPPDTPSDGKWTTQDAIDAIRYWSQKYGYSDAFTQFALAVAYGESGWNPYAHGDVDIGGSYGIFQFYTNGGRGDGYTLEQLYNPYFQSEINLPILFEQFQKYGGDEGWASNPEYVLKNGWKYGQGSIWPTDSQISSALQAVRDNYDPSSPVPYYMPSKAPVSVSPTSTPALSYNAPVFDFGGDPLGDFFADMNGGSRGSDPLSAFFASMDGGTSDPLAGLFGAEQQTDPLENFFADVGMAAPIEPVVVPRPSGSQRRATYIPPLPDIPSPF